MSGFKRESPRPGMSQWQANWREGVGHHARHAGDPLQGASAPVKVPLRCPGQSCPWGQPIKNCLARQGMCLGTSWDPPFARALLPFRPLPGAVTAVPLGPGLGSFRVPGGASFSVFLSGPSLIRPPVREAASHVAARCATWRGACGPRGLPGPASDTTSHRAPSRRHGLGNQ